MTVIDKTTLKTSFETGDKPDGNDFENLIDSCGGTIQGYSGTLCIQPANEGAPAGDDRGNYSVDLQTSRINNAQVASGTYSVITGGKSNTASGYTGTISGGRGNIASNSHSTVCGGNGNIAGGDYAFVGGGYKNNVNADYGFIGGGYDNSVNGDHGTVSGGIYNYANASSSTVGGGHNNHAEGNYSAVLGGNNCSAMAKWSAIAGGEDNLITSSGNYSFIGSGLLNVINGGRASICGGLENTASGDYNFIGGGGSNTASGDYNFIGGGANNNTSLLCSAIGGGADNTASGYTSTISGGGGNIASNSYSTVCGGRDNIAGGDYSVAMGRNAQTGPYDGSFRFADSNASAFTTGQALDSFGCRFNGGYYFYTNNSASVGVQVAGSGTSWSSISDRNIKENFEDIDHVEILERVKYLPVTKWNVIGAPTSVKHIGPMAQDFYAAFQLNGDDDKHIVHSDAEGILFSALKGLAQENQELKSRLDTVEERLNALENPV
ncbi:MAG: tail fiber domain-containing protein [Synergistaceae bacterium]